MSTYPDNPGPLPAEKLCNSSPPYNPIKGDGALGNQYRGQMLYRGTDREELVTTLQNMLLELGYDLGPSGIDGKFGDDTEKAVKQFQETNKNWDDTELKVDGLVGPETSDALNRGMVGLWYDHYQTPLTLTTDFELLTTIAEALKNPVQADIGVEKSKLRVVVTTPIPKPQPVIECETWDGWTAGNARYVVLLETGEGRGLDGEDADQYVTDNQGRVQPEHIPSEAFTLFVFPPEKVNEKVQRNDFKYVYNRSGAAVNLVKEDADREVLCIPYGIGVNIPAGEERKRRYTVVCDLSVVVLTPAIGRPCLVTDDHLDVAVLMRGELVQMWSDGDDVRKKVVKQFFLHCLRYQELATSLNNWSEEVMRWTGDLSPFNAVVDDGIGVLPECEPGMIMESTLLGKLSPKIKQAYTPWNLNTIFTVRFSIEQEAQSFNLVNLQGEDVALHLILTDREFFTFTYQGQEKPLDEFYPMIDGEDELLKQLPIETTKWDVEGGIKNGGYKTHLNGTPVKLVHPFFRLEGSKNRLNVAHVTDTHVSTRWELFEKKLPQSNFNNYNKRFSEILSQINTEGAADAVILTGDMIDYNRGLYDRTSQDDVFAKYLFNVNWLLFYEELLENYEKPVFTVLGNHEYLPNPYPTLTQIDVGADWWLIGLGTILSAGVLGFVLGFFGISERQSFGSDMNLTIAQVESLCKEGSDERYTLEMDLIGDANPLIDARKKMNESKIEEILRNKAGEQIDDPTGIWYTNVEAVTWYYLVINPFSDYCITYGETSFLLLDWNEKAVIGSLLLLPRPVDCLSRKQKELLDTWIQQGTADQLRVLCTHAPIIHTTPAVGARWLVDGMLKDEHDQILTRDDDLRYDNEIKMALPPRDKLMSVDEENELHKRKVMWGIVSDETRAELLTTLHPPSGQYPIHLILSGHTHTNKIFQIEQDGLVHLKRATDEPFPIGAQHSPLYVVTTSGGPIGWFNEAGEWLELDKLERTDEFHLRTGYRLVTFDSGVTFEQKYTQPGLQVSNDVINEANMELDWDGIKMKPTKIIMLDQAPSPQFLQDFPQNKFDEQSALIGRLADNLEIIDVEDHGDIVQWAIEAKKTAVIKKVEQNKTLTIKNNDGTIVVLDNYGSIVVEDNDDILSIDKNWPSGRIIVQTNDDDICVQQNEGVITVNNQHAEVSLDRPEMEIVQNAGTIDIQANTGGAVVRSVVYVEKNLQNGSVNVHKNDDQVTIRENLGTVSIRNDDQVNITRNVAGGTINIESNSSGVDPSKVYVDENRGVVNINGNSSGLIKDAQIHVKDNRQGTINVHSNDGNVYVPNNTSPKRGTITPPNPPGELIEEYP